VLCGCCLFICVVCVCNRVWVVAQFCWQCIEY
jgi:hypothetical protein